MKKYNLSMIMKSAHRNYKKGGITFSEALKNAWMLAKLQVRMMEMEEQRAQQLKENAKIKTHIEKTKRASFDTNIAYNAIYNTNSTGYMGAQYCGD